MPFNPNTHKRKSIRLHEYDYAQEGAYFLPFAHTNENVCLGKLKTGK